MTYGFELMLQGGGRDVQSGEIFCPEGNSHCGGDADGGGSAYDHGADDMGDIVMGAGEDIGLLKRQAGLIDEADAIGGPFEGGNHSSQFIGRSAAEEAQE